MSTTIQSHQCSQNSFLSWATRVSRTQISTVNGFSFSEGSKSGGSFTLDGVLGTVQSLGLSRCPSEDLTYLDAAGEGSTFKVARCRYHEKVVAVKYIKLGENAESERYEPLSKRLRSVLQEVCIMHHEPLAQHPTILNLLGYGWQHSGSAPLPYVVVEHGEFGSLRSWLRRKSQKNLTWLRWKLMLAGDVAAGLMALHQCGIVHGDLKLDNVIIFEGHLERPVGAIAKIADFGHSVLTLADGRTESKYYGTKLYNAPEVFTQEEVPIELAQMYKCDIWSYGLLVWETLADGEWYFRYSWRHDPAFARTSNTTSNQAGADIAEFPDTLASSERRALLRHEDSHVFGSFNVCHLRNLAKEFVNTSCGTGSQFEKSFLRPFFDQTLQVDPHKRPSDLTKLPIMRYWNQNGTARLRSKLAMQLKSSELSFDIFRLESAPEIPWVDQKGMLEDLERIASWQQGGVQSSVAAFQTGLCYILGFGTASDFSQAKFYFRQAAETSHPVVMLFNDRIFPVLTRSRHVKMSTYTKLLSHFFRNNSNNLPLCVERLKIVHQISSEIVFEMVYAQNLSTSDVLTTLPELIRKHEHSDLTGLRIYVNDMQAGIPLLEAAILSGEVDLVNWLAQRLPPLAFEILGTNGETPLIQACKLGRADMVCTLLRSGADPSVRSSCNCTMLHWIFCIEDDLTMVEEDLLIWRSSLKDVINLACEKVYTIHQQWPLRLRGTPLAFATMACSHASVEFLMELGANPTAKAFNDDTDTFGDWSALHLAIKYHLPSICRAMLKRYDSLLTSESAAGVVLTSFASALAFSSVIERYCIHSQNHAVALKDTISCLPPMWFFTMSADGRTPLMQAIDFDDIATLQSLLEHYPQLATARLSDPDVGEQYTYPILLACQLAARRDHPSAIRAPQIIATYDTFAMKRVDNHGRTCLHMAATGVSEILVDWLFSQGVVASALDHESRSALFAADNLPVFSRLAEHTNDLSMYDRHQMSLAHYAVLNGRLEILKELVKRQAPLESLCPTVGTPLHCAVAIRSRFYVSTLLEAKCNSNLLNTNGLTPMELAIEMEAPDIISEFAAHGIRLKIKSIVNTSAALESVLRSQNTAACLSTLTDEFYDRMGLFEQASTLHLLAWEGGHSSSMCLWNLIRGHSSSARKAKIRAALRYRHACPLPSGSGQTPIHTAARFLNADALKLFWDFAYLHMDDLLDENRNSPLYLALKSSDINQLHNRPSNICSILLDGGSVHVSHSTKVFASVPECYEFVWKRDAWEQAESRRDFGTLTAMMLLRLSNLDHESDANVRTGFATDLQDLFLQAVRQEEMGFIIACLRSFKVQYASMPDFLWLTRVEMMKLYHFVDQCDTNMLKWRFQTNEEVQDFFVDSKVDYVNIGGQTRNFRYEWTMLSLGRYYFGHRGESEFKNLHVQLDFYKETGWLNCVFYGQKLTLISPFWS